MVCCIVPDICPPLGGPALFWGLNWYSHLPHDLLRSDSKILCASLHQLNDCSEHINHSSSFSSVEPYWMSTFLFTKSSASKRNNPPLSRGKMGDSQSCCDLFSRQQLLSSELHDQIPKINKIWQACGGARRVVGGSPELFKCINLCWCKSSSYNLEKLLNC